MNQRLPRNMFWVDKTKMGDFLKEPLAKKLYEVYIDFKQKLPNQKYHTLKLFNEVFYQCSRIIALNKSMPDLSHVLSDIKSNLGWDYSTSIVVNMMYVVLSLQKNKTPGVTAFIKSIEHHYRLGQYKTPFYNLAETCMAHGEYFEFKPTFQIPLSEPTMLFPCQSGEDPEGARYAPIYISLNVNNHFAGEIKQMQLAHADVAVGVAEKGANVFHHKKSNE